MLRLLALSWFALVYLTITAHCTVVKRSASTCTPTLADMYCKMDIERSRNPSGKCVGGKIMCYMTSPTCRKAADCEDVCGPLGGIRMSVQSQCVSNQCRCEVTEDKCTNAADCEDVCGQLGDIGISLQPHCVSNQCQCELPGDKCTKAADCEDDCGRLGGMGIPLQPQCVNNECDCQLTEGCTESSCKATCVKEFPGKNIVSSQCMPNHSCLCNYVNPCTGSDDCKSICKKRYPGKQFTLTRCLSDGTCFCGYVEHSQECRGVADCIHVCAKKYPGKRMLSRLCMGNKQCLCQYFKGSSGSAGTLRPSELVMALILLTTMVKIPAPAQGKLWALLISPAMFGLPISQLAWV